MDLPAPDTSGLEQRLGYGFSDRQLLVRALTHSSAISPGRRVEHSYQRLEFLGDRVLGLAVAETLYNKFPGAREGELARALNSVVRKESCAQVATSLKMGDLIQMDKSEIRNGGRSKPSVLADVCEAVIGAMYLDGGLDPALEFVCRSFAGHLSATRSLRSDAKTMLQEWAQRQGLPVPRYEEVSRSGPDHSPIFMMAVHVEGFQSMDASGPSKKLAEQSVAELFLRREGVLEQGA